MGCVQGVVEHRTQDSVVIRTQYTGYGKSRPVTCDDGLDSGVQLDETELERIRSDFWGSRVEGNGLVWQSIQGACEALSNGDAMLANAILIASNITTPTGMITTCYDERGFKYDIPRHCFCSYSDDSSVHALALLSSTSRAMSSSTGVVPPEAAGSGSGSSGLGSSAIPLGTDKVPAKDISVVVRCNPGNYQFDIPVNTQESILGLKIKIEKCIASHKEFPKNVPPGKMRIMYMGKEVVEGRSVGSMNGVDAKRVVQCFCSGGK